MESRAKVVERRLIAVGLAFVGNALFPCLAYRLRWPSRLRGRALLLWILCGAACNFAILWLLRVLREARSEFEAVAEQLRVELGREPTAAEVNERVNRDHGGTSCLGMTLTRSPVSHRHTARAPGRRIGLSALCHSTCATGAA